LYRTIINILQNVSRETFIIIYVNSYKSRALF